MNNWRKIVVTLLLFVVAVLHDSIGSFAAISAEKFIEICATENPKRIRQAIKNGAKIEGQDQKYGWTPLMHMAAVATKPSTIKTLVQLGAQVEAQSADGGETPLICAALNNSNTAIFDMLVKLGAKVDTPSEYNGLTPLRAACIRKGNLKTVVFLIKHGANVNATDRWGRTALMTAAKENSSLAIIEYLLSKGADKSLKDSSGNAAYKYLSKNKNLTRKDKDKAAKLLSFHESALSILYIKQNVAPELKNDVYSKQGSVNAGAIIVPHYNSQRTLQKEYVQHPMASRNGKAVATPRKHTKMNKLDRIFIQFSLYALFSWQCYKFSVSKGYKWADSAIGWIAWAIYLLPFVAFLISAPLFILLLMLGVDMENVGAEGLLFGVNCVTFIYILYHKIKTPQSSKNQQQQEGNSNRNTNYENGGYEQKQNRSYKKNGGSYSSQERSKSRQSTGASNASGGRKEESASTAIPWPWSTLGVKQSATADEIHTAYRNLVRMYHPDQFISRGAEFVKIATVKFEDIQKAYAELRRLGRV